MRRTKVISVGDQSIEFRFGLAFVGEYIEKMGMTADEIDEKLEENPFKYVPALMYESYSFAFRVREEVPKMNFYEFCDMIDDHGGVQSEFVRSFLNGFTESFGVDLPIDESDETEKKN